MKLHSLLLLAALLIPACRNQAQAPVTRPRVEPSAAPVHAPWEMTYWLDDASSELVAAAAYVWVTVDSDGRVEYSLTTDYADSNAAAKEFCITSAQAEQIREGVIRAVGELTFQYPGPDGTLGEGASLSGCVGAKEPYCSGGKRFQMLIPTGRAAGVARAFEPVLEKARRMKWTYDPFGLNSN